MRQTIQIASFVARVSVGGSTINDAIWLELTLAGLRARLLLDDDAGITNDDLSVRLALDGEIALPRLRLEGEPILPLLMVSEIGRRRFVNSTSSSSSSSLTSLTVKLFRD